MVLRALPMQHSQLPLTLFLLPILVHGFAVPSSRPPLWPTYRSPRPFRIPEAPGWPQTVRSVGQQSAAGSFSAYVGVAPAAAVVAAGAALLAGARRAMRGGALRMDGMEEALSAQLNAVRALRPAPLDAAEAARVQLGLWKAAGKQSQDLASFRISGIFTGEPSFTRLFDHAMWARYTKGPNRKR